MYTVINIKVSVVFPNIFLSLIKTSLDGDSFQSILLFVYIFSISFFQAKQGESSKEVLLGARKPF